MYHDKQAAIIVEYSNQHTSQQAAQNVSLSHPDLATTIIEDMRQILNKDNNTTHTQRVISHTQLKHNSSVDTEYINETETAQPYTY